MEQYNFCTIVEQFCQSLVNILQIVKDPIQTINVIIKKKKFRTIAYDDYINNLENFNELMLEIIEEIRQMIVNLKLLFVNKSQDSFASLVNSLKRFLEFIKNRQVYQKLFEYKITFEDCQNGLQRQRRIFEELKVAIMTLICISLGIASLMFPHILPFAAISNLVKSNETGEIDEKDYVEFNIDDIIEKLLGLSIHSELITNINIENILEGLKYNDNIIKTTEKLQVDYFHLMKIHLELSSEIKSYRKKFLNPISYLIHSPVKIFRKYI